mgnify:CR=1 FL=1
MMRHLATRKTQTAVLALIVAPAISYSETTTGTLEVRSEVGAICQIEDLTDLTLDFDNQAAAFGDLELATMAFNIACKGSPTVNDVTFSEGDNYEAPQRAVANGNGDFIEYALYAAKGEGTLDNSNYSNETPLGGNFDGLNILDINEDSVTNQAVTVGVILKNIRDDFGATPGDVPTGEYSDSITVTVTYSG